MAIKKIEKSQIDFSKIYSSQKSAQADDGNYVKAHEEYWGDTGDLYFDDETGMVSEDGIGIGFINKKDLLNITKAQPVEKNYSKIYDTKAALAQKRLEERQAGISNEASPYEIKSIQITTPLGKKKVNANDNSQFVSRNSEVNIEDIVPEAAETPKQYKPDDFNYSYEDSNILAAKAKNMGFTDEQVKIAIGISRHETGNYKHLAYGFNYGGVTGKGDLGSQGGYAKYSSKDVGMDAYLSNLKKNYFDMGLNTVESLARKYLGYDDTSHWISSVHKCMK